MFKNRTGLTSQFYPTNNFLNADGFMPLISLKQRVKWLWSKKPQR